jgi:hypothetical protein
MSAKETAKELLAKIKAVFDGPAAPAAPAAPSAPTPTVYSLADGTQIAITQAGDTPAPGDVVTIAGAPAPEGTLTLQDGSTITVDATGTITACTPVTPAAAAPAMAAPAATPAPAPVVPVTQSAMSEMIQKFAVGDPEQRVANLETVCKALMEYCFGYQIEAEKRLTTTNDAIAVYKTTLDNQTTELEAAKVSIAKYDAAIPQILELVGKIVELPVTEPKTLTGNKKEKFDRTNAKEEKLNKIAAAMKELRKGK